MEAEAFEQAAREHQDMVFRIALNYCRNPADADDITQNVLLRLLRHGGGFETEPHLRHWLIRVAVNESKRWLSSPYHLFTGKAQPYDETLTLQYSLEPEERELYAALLQLPAKYRIVLYLHYYEGYSAAEMGKLLLTGTSTVTTRLQRGRDRLKIILAEAEKTPGKRTSQNGAGKECCCDE